MSLPAQPWPYAFWPAWLLTGRSRLVPPLATIRRLHLMLDAHASFRQRSSDMSCQSPERCHFQDLVRPSSGTFPGVKGYIPYQDGNTKYEITGIGLELDNSDKETIQSKASKKKQKDRKREDNRLRQVLQRKLSMKKMEHLVVNRGREQLIGNAKGNTQQLDQRSEPE